MVNKWTGEKYNIQILFDLEIQKRFVKSIQENIQTTKKLCEAGKILDIPVLDHIIITDETFYSIRGSLPSIFT